MVMLYNLMHVFHKIYLIVEKYFFPKFATKRYITSNTSNFISMDWFKTTIIYKTLMVTNHLKQTKTLKLIEP